MLGPSRYILNQLPYAIWASDEYSNIIFTNTVFNCYTGTNDVKMSETEAASFIHPDDLDGFYEVYTRSRSMLIAYQYEVRIRGCDDQYRRHIVTGNPLYEGDNRLVGYLGTAQDISEYKPENPKELVREDLFSTLFQHMPLGISICDQDCNILDVNPMYEIITGRTKSRLCNMKWTEYTHPCGLQSELVHFEKMKSGELDNYTTVKRYIKPDQSMAWASVFGSPLTVGGLNIGKYIYMVSDITEHVNAVDKLQENERFLSMLLSNMPGMAFRCEPGDDWSTQYVSAGCCKLTGLRPKFLIENKGFYLNTIVNKEYRQYLWQRRHQAITTKEIFKHEYMITTVQGEQKWVCEHIQGVYDSSGELTAVEGFVADITEIKEKEIQILHLHYHDNLTGLGNRRFFEAVGRNIDRTGLLPVSVVVAELNGLKTVKEALGPTVEDQLLISISRILSDCCREKDILAKTGDDEFSILLPGADYDEAYKLIQRIRMQLKKSRENIHDVTRLVMMHFGCATKKHQEELVADIVNEAKRSIYEPQKKSDANQLNSIFSVVNIKLLANSKIMEERNMRVMDLSWKIGMKLNLSEDELKRLALLSMVHNLGYVGVSSNILSKPDKLTDEEWMVVKKHPEIGYRIALTSPELALVAEDIFCHHEWWDGNGYPNGLKGEDIPLFSRIIAVLDAYDAMMQERKFRKVMSKEEAIAEIEKNAGTQFDPFIVKTFIEAIREEESES